MPALSRPVGIMINIAPKAKLTIDRQARERSIGSAFWAGQIFDMGFAAVCAREKSMPISDADLDAIVGATLLLQEQDHWDVEKLAKWLGVPSATISSILAGWKAYRRAT